MKTKLIFLFIILFLNVKNSFIYADRIEFSNGDCLTGEIVELNKDNLIINTTIAGTLTIKRSAIKKIEKETPIQAIFSSGKVVQGNLEFAKDKVTIHDKDQKISVPWEGVDKIVPVEIVSETQDSETHDKISTQDKRKWSGVAKLLASLQKGTTDTTNLESSVSITGKKEKDSMEIELFGAYGEVEDEINTRRYGGRLRYQYYPEEKWYVYTDMNAERDEGRKLGLRGQTGGGTGYEIFSQAKQKWSLEGALMFTHEEWLPFIPYEEDKVRDQKIHEGLNEINQASQGLIQNPISLDYIGRFISGTAKLIDPLGGYEKITQDYASLKIRSKYSRNIMNSEFSHTLTFEPSLERIDYYRVNLLTNLSTPVSESMSIEITLSNDYDSESQMRDVESWEHRLSAGIKYEFGQKN